MTSHPLLRRVLTTAAATLVVGGTALTTGAAPAAATTAWALRPGSVTYVDSATPGGSLSPENGAVPVGAWTDTAGVGHTARAFLTYDLTGFAGVEFSSAYAYTHLTSATDCSAARQTELRRTAVPSTAPTWDNQPAELTSLRTLVSDPASGCARADAASDVLYALRKASAEHADHLTLELRVPKKVESDLRQGQWFASDVVISAVGNHAPDLPTAVTVDGKSCQGDDKPFVANRTPTLAALATDPDGGQFDATFAVWPVDHPDQRTEFTSVGNPSGYRAQHPVSAGVLADGVTYAVAVRATDPVGAESKWTARCRFTADWTGPAAAPAVTSAEYLENLSDDAEFGGTGVPGTFAFSAGGDKDVVGFVYTDQRGGGTYVEADRRGGRATAQVTPLSVGPQELRVVSLDRAGNRSPERVYRFFAPYNQPYYTDSNRSGGLGEPRTLTFHPSSANVVEYTYWLDDGARTTVAAGPDQTAVVTYVPDWTGRKEFHLQARSGRGWLTGIATKSIYVDNRPRISSVEYPEAPDTGPGGVGIPGTFILRPGLPGVVSYVYSFDFGTEVTVAAGPDGTAAVTWTPDGAYDHTLTVRSLNSDGTESLDRQYDFTVN